MLLLLLFQKKLQIIISVLSENMRFCFSPKYELQNNRKFKISKGGEKKEQSAKKKRFEEALNITFRE